MNIAAFSECANCGACVNACPCDAIQTDGSGLFYELKIDENKCVQCGKCAAVCPVNRPVPAQSVIGAYAAVHRDAGVVKRSSSGGAMSALAETVIKQGGVVYGAAFDDSCQTVRFASTETRDPDELRRSKYVESLVGTVFRDIKTKLEEGRRVLFCGTPCQAAGLRAFLGSPDEKLLICDFSCGGLPSHRMYREYLTALERKYGAKTATVNFRPKLYGWRQHAIQIGFKNRKTYRSLASLDPYFSAFVYKKYNVRQYCTHCGFSDHHMSDITLADFWRSKQITGEADNDTGISLILTNTEKGEQALAQCEALTVTKLPADAAQYNIKATVPTDGYAEKRERFMQAYQQTDVMQAGKKYTVVKGKTALKAHLREILKK